MTAPFDAAMLQRACDLTGRIMNGVTPEQMTAPTPCGDWTVQELMEHIVASTDFFADAAERGAVSDDREWPDYAANDLVPAFRRHADRLVAAFRAPGVMERPMVILAGPATASFCLQVAIGERLVHAWDLAVATGQPFGQEHTDIAEALIGSPEYVAVNSEVRGNSPAPLGPEVPVDPGAPAVDRLVAFLGRDPHYAVR